MVNFSMVLTMVYTAREARGENFSMVNLRLVQNFDSKNKNIEKIKKLTKPHPSESWYSINNSLSDWGIIMLDQKT